ncbi:MULTISPECIES: ATP-binding cassette domain-containing protein [Paenibacillus]|uniref:ATP-binding cassette domain-containing protein n=1 Tax=Paenibacillus TaxID=44249 RepID=UPI0022B93EAA|nr:ATP-binding cassette domain-containing protein [Paenibacillus caseinilyticus]MCZ8522739.1 ATP-binding cassette domain-containing protein [Paenibacillus caseinilyticus]
MSRKQGTELRLAGVSKTFGEKSVLTGIDLELKPGEFVAIVGRSGCGKSTLLRLVAGLETASEGSLHINGAAAKGIHTNTRVMFQDARLLPWQRVLANVEIGTPPGDKASAAEALRLVGLEDRAGAWPGVLSGGQKQRVSLARALAGRPRLLLLDEPLGALDALTRIEMQGLIERLWLEQGFSAILVTHDVSEAVALADRVVLIEEGRIAMDLAIELDRPRERDSGFVYYEKRILDRVMQRETGEREPARQREIAYSI